MRKIGTLPDLGRARRFAAAVAARGLETTLRPTPEGAVEVWAAREDRIDAARAELAAFQADPDAERFRVAVPPAAGPARQRPTAAAQMRRCPVTVALIVAATAVTLAAHHGPWQAQTLDAVSIAPYVIAGNRVTWDGLERIEHGELWRLVTPILPHADPFSTAGGLGFLHLLSNMGALWVFGSAVELTRGPLRMATIVLAIAAVSNLAEYWFNLGWTFDPGEGFRKTAPFFRPDPVFYGMSGVVFGLFGLIWTRARLLPASGFLMPRDLVVMMLVWAAACTAGFVGPIANVGHLSGLLAGAAIGAAPRLWRRA